MAREGLETLTLAIAVSDGVDCRERAVESLQVPGIDLGQGRPQDVHDLLRTVDVGLDGP